jgi:hypothetical protein
VDFEAGWDFILGEFRHDSSSGAESAELAFRIAASAALFDELAACHKPVKTSRRKLTIFQFLLKYLEAPAAIIRL